MKIFIASCKRMFKTVIRVLCTFVLWLFVDEIFQFDFFALTTNYVTVCIIRHHKADCDVDLLRDDVRKYFRCYDYVCP